MSKRRARRPFTSEQKAGILRRHMVDKVPISELCNELGLQPSLFYQWQRQAMENLAAAMDSREASGPSAREKELGKRVSYLEERLAKKDGVIAEISAEYVQLKKALGEP